MLWIAAIVLMSGAAFGLQEADDASDASQDADRSYVMQNIDRRAAERCIGNLVGITGVRMQCTVAEDGSATDCEILNPSPAVLRHQRVFHCMASHMTFTYRDGTPAAGYRVRLNLGARSEW